MASYRKGLQRINVSPAESISTSSFVTRPRTLRGAIAAMHAPLEWQQVAESWIDENWPDECQGVACDGVHWFFTANNPKVVYVFRVGLPLTDENILHTFRFADHVPYPQYLYHIGQLTLHQGCLYVSHYDERARWSSIFVLRIEGHELHYEHTIEAERPISIHDGKPSFPQFQCVAPWENVFYTAIGWDFTSEFYLHDLTTGKWTGRVLRFKGMPATFPRHYPAQRGIGYTLDTVQGACVSPEGHLYISAENRLVDAPAYKAIWVFSVLNGQYQGHIPILAENDDQEPEGICWADVPTNGSVASLHVVLLENRYFNRDNVFFKQFRVKTPSVE